MCILFRPHVYILCYWPELYKVWVVDRLFWLPKWHSMYQSVSKGAGHQWWCHSSNLIKATHLLNHHLVVVVDDSNSIPMMTPLKLKRILFSDDDDRDSIVICGVHKHVTLFFRPWLMMMHSVGFCPIYGHFCPTFRDKIDESFLRFFKLTLVLLVIYSITGCPNKFGMS